jgi:hypothetical protein
MTGVRTPVPYIYNVISLPTESISRDDNSFVLTRTFSEKRKCMKNSAYHIYIYTIYRYIYKIDETLAYAKFVKGKHKFRCIMSHV